MKTIKYRDDENERENSEYDEFFDALAVFGNDDDKPDIKITKCL